MSEPLSKWRKANEHKQVPFCRPHQFWNEIKGAEANSQIYAQGKASPKIVESEVATIDNTL
ncbi:MAG: hypothetical protein QNJ72_21565 [Pleurocapsa sp. MO_226.B13]|nr:hypothetical protein [Pleurocapsa sp. MO_226.B13]